MPEVIFLKGRYGYRSKKQYGIQKKWPRFELAFGLDCLRVGRLRRRERVLKALIESIAIFKTNKQKSFAVWRKYMRGASEEFLEDTYQHTIAAMEAVPTPSVQVIASALDMISVHYPQAKQTDPNLIVDPSFVRRIDQSGFITALYKKQFTGW